ncbi:MAG TPA: PmoA family protein [Gemmata sp.]|nr:PmoA family protein [Gemmata sp.]
MRFRHFLALTCFLTPASARAADVTAVVGKDAIEFKSGTEIVAKYFIATTYSKPFLYPVLAPGGVPVTRGWPIEKGLPGEVKTDHVHQKSVWFCHGDVIPEGLELKTKSANRGDQGVDFWSEATDKSGKRRHGQIRVVKVGEPKKTDGGVSVETQNEWFTADGEKMMDETRVISFRETTEGRLFTFDITLKASVCPIAFWDTKEGSFGIRVHDSLRPEAKDGAVVTTAEGKSLAPPQRDNLPIWGYPTAWIDYSGKVFGKEVGIAVFDHPDNLKANWHVRAYGLNAANPFAREHSGFPTQKGKKELYKLPKGGELRLKYAVYAHTGDAKSGKVAAAYASFEK